ncbi:MAG: UDP-N-acetylenolpyruvoylglucosamine reductase [Candidatus Levybacteria bacterium]|nr:UDP-N-acetylenolpyruvoylglucosamine reductase [Candidatus Levybacteria bacterium]
MNLQKNVPLKNYSNYKIGGQAQFFVEVGSVDELKEVQLFVKQNQDLQFFILSGGTNVLINDEGFDGLIILNRIKGIEREGNNLRIGSGTLMRDVLEYCLENSLSGLEWAGGLPGTIAGAVRGNAGAFKGETKNSVLGVESLDIQTANEKIRSNPECQIDYRDSIFKSGDGVYEFITYVILKLTPGDKDEIRRMIVQKIDYRNNRHPMNFPSIGSTFKNIPLNSLSMELQKEFAAFVKTDPFPVVPTTKLLALCGLKGKRMGGAMISEKHPNFIVNVDDAKAADVKLLIEIAKQAVREKYNIILEEEIVYLN